MSFRLPDRIHRALVAESLKAEPSECCGVLGGHGRFVEAIYPVTNGAAQPDRRYEMPPAELWAAQRRARADGLDVVGFYHSHPRTEPVPSSYDVSRAYYPEAVYVIVGIYPRPIVRAYRIAGGQFDELTIDIV